MFVLCDYICSYCGRPIETSFVTVRGRHYHALENACGEKAERSCYDLSRQRGEPLYPDKTAAQIDAQGMPAASDVHTPQGLPT